MLRAAKLSLIAWALGLATQAPADTHPSLADLTWMKGAWQGQVGGDADNPQYLEETWSYARAGTMMAMVRMRTNTATIFVELISITQGDDTLHLHIQQFAPDMTPRFEPAQRMKLTELGEQQATFKADTTGGLDTLVYTRDGEDFTIDVTLSEGAKFVAKLSAAGAI